jgi:DMSO reductase family type II enzyme heme b subunit
MKGLSSPPTVHGKLILAVVVFASACAGVLAAVAPDLTPAQQAGKRVYQEHCATCHGFRGEGNGPASVWLFPKPRNFAAGLYKIQSTPAGFLPTDDDMLQAITRGMPGSSMPSFTYLTEKNRREVVQYVKYLTAEEDTTGKRINKFDEAAKKGAVGKPVTVPPEPADTVESLAKGRELFTKLGCVACHGETGAGDGPSAPTLKDTFGNPSIPRDFNNESFRGGHTGPDLYLRIHNGMAGTPMPPFGADVMKADERWALVNFIQSLRRKEIEVNEILGPADNLIKVEKLKRQVPTEPFDPFWEELDPVRVPVNPLWPEPYTIHAILVRAVQDNNQIAFLLQWRDATLNGAPLRVHDFQDAVAMQFSMTATPGFLGMGDSDHPVNLWQWKSGWQQEIDGRPVEMLAAYPAMHVDFYSETNSLFRTAFAANNLLSKTPTSPIEDANARGFSTLRSQPPQSQNVRGKGIWRDGFWSVVFIRNLRSQDKDDIQFTGKDSIPIAFAVWDGEQRDRGARKEISNWYRLTLTP